MNKDSGPINDCQNALIGLAEISLLNNSQLCLTASFMSQILSHPEVTRSTLKKQINKKRRESMRPSKSAFVSWISCDMCKADRLANWGEVLSFLIHLFG